MLIEKMYSCTISGQNWPNLNDFSGIYMLAIRHCAISKNYEETENVCVFSRRRYSINWWWHFSLKHTRNARRAAVLVGLTSSVYKRNDVESNAKEIRRKHTVKCWALSSVPTCKSQSPVDPGSIQGSNRPISFTSKVGSNKNTGNDDTEVVPWVWTDITWRTSCQSNNRAFSTDQKPEHEETNYR